MRDIWSFLLQTLTAAGAAALILTVKAVFQDKLSPRWQFSVWGVLGLVLLLPAGFGGRYALFNWPWLVESLRSLLTGEYGVLAHVTVPIPLPAPAAPRTAAEWLYLIYAAGVLLLLGFYGVSYLRLRLLLRRGTPADSAPLHAVARQYGLPVCPAVEVEGLSSAFVCGVFRPVLALPAGKETREKVILHELLHLKHHDAAWGLLICFFRCLHWCNPLLWYCADRAGNDLESLCDQRVLERLEGEDRRDYGRILLGMADARYARAPGTSSMANGGRQIRRRIEAIARFKKYPRGMALVSVCVAMTLAAPLLLGTRAQAVRKEGGFTGVDRAAAMASARTTYCTTYAGALDTYAKAVLDGNILYRAMCAPLAEQTELAEQLRQAQNRSSWPPNSDWASGLPGFPKASSGYQIYNLNQTEPGIYEGLLVVELMEPPAGESRHPNGYCWLAFQPLRTERESSRWVVRPLGDFQAVEATGWMQLPTRCDELPNLIYEDQTGDFILRMTWQTTCRVDSYASTGTGFFSTQVFETTPQPGGEFSSLQYHTALTAVYTGDQDRRREIRSVAASCAPMEREEQRPELRNPGGGDSSGSSSDGEAWGAASGFGRDENEIFLGGGGSGFSGKHAGMVQPPAQYAADFYVNGEKTAELTLLPLEGGFQ